MADGAKITPLCPACQSEMKTNARLLDMTGYQLVFCGRCGFTIGAVNYF
jgi:predicted amidophosphoribosyltransferase